MLIMAVLLVGMVRLVSERRDEGDPQQLQENARVPEFAVRAESGDTFSNQSLLGKTSGLLFVSPDCPTCMATIGALEVINSRVEHPLIVVCRSSRGKCESIVESLRDRFPVVIDNDEGPSRKFGITNNPTAVMMSDVGTILRYGHPLQKEELDDILATI